MNNPTQLNLSKNVVDLQQRQASQAAAGERLGDLLKLVRGTALKRLNTLVSILFENVDDALFGLAERAENNAVQTQYFDGMREVRKKRQLVERVFQEQLSQIFTDFANGSLKPAKPELTNQSGSGLSLVDDLELEESLAISAMVAKAENRLARHLYAVNQRLSVTNGGIKVDDSINPIGPAQLSEAFRQAMGEFEVNVKVKLIIYKLFDRYVMAGLESVYDEVNNELIRAGVLPHIRHEIATGKINPRRTAPASPSAGTQQPYSENATANFESTGYAASESASYNAAAIELQSELYNTLRSLLENRRGGGSSMPISEGGEYPSLGMGSGATPTNLASLASNELLSALTILQNQMMVAQGHSSASNSSFTTAQAVQQIKQELLEQAQRLVGESRGGHVSAADEDTIDLVGMLFEYILQDRNLPAEIQALLGRLQIPYLKVAILDRHLFAQSSHPARQLLDVLARAGMGWSEEADRDHHLHDRIKRSVESILKDFDDDVGIFERELHSFDTFMKQYRHRAELVEQRTTEATRGRERLHTARRIAAREILKRIDGCELPPLVYNVLSRPWANYLVLTLLRQGEGSDEWRNALRFADEFIWSAQPKKNEADKARAKLLLPQLEKALQHGLTTVAYHDNDIKQLMLELSKFYDLLFNDGEVELKTAHEVIAENASPTGAVSPSAKAIETSALGAPVVQDLVEEIVLGTQQTEVEVQEEHHAADDDEYIKMAKEMKTGTWIEFTDEQGVRERAKLSWISPISSKCLFVNRRGLKVCEKTVYALAIELRRGSAAILEEVPLFDRALDAIVERLRAVHKPDHDDTTPPNANPSLA